MQYAEHGWTDSGGWTGDVLAAPDAVQLVLYFTARPVAGAARPYGALHALYPQAIILGCSTGGEIAGLEVQDNSVVAIAIRLDRSTIRSAQASIAGPEQSQDIGTALASSLPADGLRAVFVLADGMLTNGSGLIAGLRQGLAGDVIVTGGLAGDGAAFRETLVGLNEEPLSGRVAAIGFYGADLRVGWGSVGGWDRFGPERLITRSRDNILYELDGEPALDLYKRYLGAEAAHLPGSGLFFPLTVRPQDDEKSAVVRTIVGIDEAQKAMIFAGDIPQGHVAQLMRGNFDGLIDGAGQAGHSASLGRKTASRLAILVSCIGRKLLMGQEITEEVEAAAEALGDGTRLIGFYSYGEIAPHGFTGRCELHNQTMTITTLSED